MGTGFIGARNKRKAPLRNSTECLARIGEAANLRRVGRWADDNEIVVHHVSASDAEAVGDKFFLIAFAMAQDHIDIAVASEFQDLAGATQGDANFVAGFFFECRDEPGE